MGQEFNLGSNNYTTLAFQLKTAYYKNLAYVSLGYKHFCARNSDKHRAYEILNFHHRQPPPRSILEDVSAKGADLLNRTLENYRRPLTRDELVANGVDGDGSDDEGHTPGVDPMEVDDPGSIGKRGEKSGFSTPFCSDETSALRQAPPQRVLFQPDTSVSRQHRQFSAQAASPAPQMANYNGTNGLISPHTSAGALIGYEPKQQLPLTLRPVLTPGNNPDQFKANQKTLRDALLATRSKTVPPIKGLMLPGSE